ncbi:MAG: phosphate/phosphite/phosphonate ABC transporter substrate-binding protein [Desulfobacteraceae bacterium]|nr:phosphate/phosphite/phosphonate ABC transporter substrate-binding protein [Desulfobacteraceae bacterium]
MHTQTNHSFNFKTVLILIVGLCLFFIQACGRDDSPIKVDLNERMHIKPKIEQNIITYAYLPQYSHTTSYKRHHQIIKYLRKQTGLNIKQIFPDTFDQHMTMLENGKVDISFSNPFIYVKIADQFDAKAFARIVTIQDQENFRGQVICRADNKRIKTLEDCRGKTWIAVDSSSAGGYLFPLGLFYSHGIFQSDFKEIAFAPGPGAKQEKVVFAVHAGEYDIGTIREGTLNVVANRINTSDIRIISNTPLYPGWVYATRKNLDQKVIQKIKKALLALDFNKKEDRLILEAADFIKVIPSIDQEFDPIRKLASDLEVSK